MDSYKLRQLIDIDMPDNLVCERSNPDGVRAYNVFSEGYESNREYEIRRNSILSRQLP